MHSKALSPKRRTLPGFEDCPADWRPEEPPGITPGPIECFFYSRPLLQCNMSALDPAHLGRNAVPGSNQIRGACTVVRRRDRGSADMDEEALAEISAWYVRFADAEARGRPSMSEKRLNSLAQIDFDPHSHSRRRPSSLSRRSCGTSILTASCADIPSTRRNSARTTPPWVTQTVWRSSASNHGFTRSSSLW